MLVGACHKFCPVWKDHLFTCQTLTVSPLQLTSYKVHALLPNLIFLVDILLLNKTVTSHLK
jgi:hypothetical protein